MSCWGWLRGGGGVWRGLWVGGWGEGVFEVIPQIFRDYDGTTQRANQQPLSIHFHVPGFVFRLYRINYIVQSKPVLSIDPLSFLC